MEHSMTRPSIVGISGSLSAPSRTLSFVQHAAERIAGDVGGEAHIIDIAALSGVGTLRTRAEADAHVEAALRAVETADLLVAGSPVYKGSYSGLFKHFIDFVDYRSLIGTPVALLATGGSDRHALVIEHQLRPLFAFFQAAPLGTGLFLTDRDLAEGRIASGPAEQRFERLVEEAAHALKVRNSHQTRIAGAAA
jgi:FMN reductase